MKYSLIRKSCLWGVLLTLTISGCSTALHDSSQRSPSSLSDTPIVPRNLRVAIQEFKGFVTSSAFNTQTCAPRLEAIYHELYKMPPSHFDLETLRPEALKVVEELWEARVELRKKFVKMASSPRLSPDCVNAVRRAQVAGRFIEEYLAEWATSPAEGDPKHPPLAWSGSFPGIVQSPDFDSLELRSGDLLLSRGDPFTSAAIARIGDVEGQFSHLAMVYVDEKTGQKYTIEAHLEKGVVAAPIDAYLKESKIRSELFRFRGDASLAHEAAKYMYERASRASASGKNIPYDFRFDLNDDSEIFCSEVATLGYRMASKGKIELPTFQSKMTAKHREFLNDIGMTGSETFAPMDLEVDPHFDLVAEWRDLSRTEQSHRKDEVLTAMFTWMQEYHYVLDPAEWTEVGSSALWQLRQWPVFDPLLKDKMSLNMSKRTLQATMAISFVGEDLFNEITRRDRSMRELTGLWLTPYQLFESLDQIRTEDLSLWKRGKKSRFHKRFHPVADSVNEQ